MPPSALHHLVYQSVSTMLLTEEDLEKLLKQSRAWNESHGLTGLLLYSEGHIMQVLEGHEEDVRYIFGRIEHDQRHFGVTKLSDGPIQSRNFTQWSMGFTVLDPTAFQQLSGYQNPNSPTSFLATYSENGNISLHELLASFADQDKMVL